jgi:hypothetical protein
MPGSPPMRTIDPATSPPPSNLSNSDKPVRSLSRRVDFTSESGCREVPAGRGCGDRVPVLGMISSAYVFHSPQEGQRPIHLLDLAPHCWQTNSVFGLAFCRSKDFIVDVGGGIAFHKRQDNNFPTNFHHHLVFGQFFNVAVIPSLYPDIRPQDLH